MASSVQARGKHGQRSRTYSNWAKAIKESELEVWPKERKHSLRAGEKKPRGPGLSPVPEKKVPLFSRTKK